MVWYKRRIYETIRRPTIYQRRYRRGNVRGNYVNYEWVWVRKSGRVEFEFSRGTTGLIATPRMCGIGLGVAHWFFGTEPLSGAGSSSCAPRARALPALRQSFAMWPGLPQYRQRLLATRRSRSAALILPSDPSLSEMSVRGLEEEDNACGFAGRGLLLLREVDAEDCWLEEEEEEAGAALEFEEEEEDLVSFFGAGFESQEVSSFMAQWALSRFWGLYHPPPYHKDSLWNPCGLPGVYRE